MSSKPAIGSTYDEFCDASGYEGSIIINNGILSVNTKIELEKIYDDMNTQLLSETKDIPSPYDPIRSSSFNPYYYANLLKVHAANLGDTSVKYPCRSDQEYKPSDSDKTSPDETLNLFHRVLNLNATTRNGKMEESITVEKIRYSPTAVILAQAIFDRRER